MLVTRRGVLDISFAKQPDGQTGDLSTERDVKITIVILESSRRLSLSER